MHTTHSIRMPQISSFEIEVSYIESDPSIPRHRLESHVHDVCEIYVYLTGDVSFMVENRIYAIQPGSVIITRPYEYHHCVYQSNILHKHFVLYFPAKGLEPVLDLFFERNAGEKNLFVLTETNRSRLYEVCRELLSAELSNAEKYLRFFTVIDLLRRAEIRDTREAIYPDVAFIMDEINNRFADNLSIRELAAGAGVSLNTLERHFGSMLKMTPTQYLKQKRLAKAYEMLAGDHTVTETAALCGYNSISALEMAFRSVYGITPYQYQKKIRG